MDEVDRVTGFPEHHGWPGGGRHPEDLPQHAGVLAHSIIGKNTAQMTSGRKSSQSAMSRKLAGTATASGLIVSLDKKPVASLETMPIAKYWLAPRIEASIW